MMMRLFGLIWFGGVVVIGVDAVAVSCYTGRGGVVSGERRERGREGKA